MSKQRHLEFLTGTNITQETAEPLIEKELGAVYTFQELVSLEKARNERETVIIQKKNSFKQISTVKDKDKEKEREREKDKEKECECEAMGAEGEDIKEEKKDPEQVFLMYCRDED